MEEVLELSPGASREGSYELRPREAAACLAHPTQGTWLALGKALCCIAQSETLLGAVEPNHRAQEGHGRQAAQASTGGSRSWAKTGVPTPAPQAAPALL